MDPWPISWLICSPSSTACRGPSSSSFIVCSAARYGKNTEDARPGRPNPALRPRPQGSYCHLFPPLPKRVEVPSQIHNGTTSQESRCLQKPSLKSLLSLMWKCTISPALELSGQFGLWMIGCGGLPMASCPGEKRRASVPAYRFISSVFCNSDFSEFCGDNRSQCDGRTKNFWLPL